MFHGEAKPRIAIVAHYAFGAMSGGTRGFVGGVERQTSMTARWLAGRGYPVSLITWDEGQPDDLSIAGVRVIKMCTRDAGVRGLRFFHPRWSSLHRALRRADADVYYQNCAEYVTGQVAIWCRRRNRRFVYSVANNPDVEPSLPDMKTVRERVLYRYGIRHADRIIVQTRWQHDMLRRGFGVASTVIPMPCPGPGVEHYEPPVPPDGASRAAVWVGRICEQKRPDRLLEVAARCPDLEFVVVGTPDDSDLARRFMQQVRDVPNVTLRGSVPRSEMPEVYRSAALLCCTSDFEGFPNTFLESWSHGLPIVSMFDPDDLIRERGLGAAAGDVDGVVAGIRGLLESPAEWRGASERGRRYYVDNHTVDKVLPRFEEVFLDAVGGSGGGR